jgi:cytidylate kinase
MVLITITSGIGCGASSVASQVSRRLGISLFDNNKLYEKARDMGIDAREIDVTDKRAPGFWSRLLDFKPRVYAEFLEAVVLEAASGGEGIFLGHGSAFLLQDFDCALHVKIYSNPSERIRQVMEKSGLSFAEAKSAVEKADALRKGFIQYAFHRDWDDLSLYDIIINRDKINGEAVVDLIVQSASAPGIHSCSLKALEFMDRLSLKIRVKAVIQQTSLKPEGFSVEVPSPGVVQVSGEINPLESRDRLLDAIRAVPGVRSVDARIRGEKLHDL